MTKRITRLGVTSSAKVGGVLFILLGFTGSLAYAIYMVAKLGGLPEKDGWILPAMPVFAGAIIGFYGVLFGALAAWVFNATSKLTGGIEIELEDPEPEL